MANVSMADTPSATAYRFLRLSRVVSKNPLFHPLAFVVMLAGAPALAAGEIELPPEDAAVALVVGLGSVAGLVVAAVLTGLWMWLSRRKGRPPL